MCRDMLDYALHLKYSTRQQYNMHKNKHLCRNALFVAHSSVYLKINVQYSDALSSVSMQLYYKSKYCAVYHARALKNIANSM